MSNEYDQPKDRSSSCLNWLISAFIFIVFILILFPIFVQWREGQRDKTISCISNIKQINLGLLMYSQDFDGYMPSSYNKASAGIGWAEFIHSYIKSNQVFQCPEDQFKLQPNDTNPFQSISYGYNSNLDGKNVNKIPNAAIVISIFETTGSTIDLIDPPTVARMTQNYSPAGNGLDGKLYCSQTLPCPAKYATGTFGRPVSAISQFDASGPRHNGGSNFGFADGHAKWIKPGIVSAGTNALTSKDAQTGGVTGRAAGTESPEIRATFSLR